MTRLGIHSACIVSFFAKPCRGFKNPLPSRVSSPAQATQSRYPSAFEFRLPAPISRRAAHSAVEAASSDEVKYEHTVAQTARAASQAVRVATHEGKLRDAFYVVNSVLQSPLEPWVVPPRRSRRLLNPLNFGRPVPTRLVVHTLIHALLREGYTIQAGREVNKLISMGVRFRYKTVEANVHLLCSKPSRQMEAAQLLGKAVRNQEVLKNDWVAFRSLQNKTTRLIPETRLALDLLSAARESGHRRTERMYGWVVDACLLQGEILVATLLFVILVKDWQLKKVLQSAPVGDRHLDDASATATKRQYPDATFHDMRKRKLAKDIGLDDDRIKIPRPESSMMQRILNSINSRSSLDPCTLSNAAKADYGRSLSYLANLVDRRSLPFSQISPLIRALYSCPVSQSNIFILEDDREFHANVYNYSHEVLLRLCQSLPSQRSTPSPALPEVLPPLDTHAYNSLIHYALRHRLSPALADSVIQHMTVFRKPSLRPDITTYNILLHSASTLRLPGLANQVLNTLRARHGNYPKPESEATLSPSVELLEKGEDLGHAIGQITVPATESPAQANDHCAPVHSIHVDVYTLCTYVTHLVRTGRPEIVAEILFRLVPEIHIIDHPATSPPARDGENIGDNMQLSQHESLLRAIAYGPYVFTVLLNALQKANKVGLAERVWLLARRAERASWMQSESADAHAPWCLPIQAYTSMMQCYANESKKGALLIRGSRYSYKLSSSLSLMRDRRLKQQRADNLYVKGWAYFYFKMQAQEGGQECGRPVPRWKTAREVGYLLLKSMRSGALSVWQDLMALQPENMQTFSPQQAYILDSLKLPVADARFYNAVLDMFGRTINMQARRVRPSPSWWTRKLRIAQRIHRDTGWTPVVYDHTLVEIARGMADAGYELPLGLRRALVGRFPSRLRYAQRHEHQVAPFAFPRPKKLRHRMFSLCVTKSRGLPLGRRKPEVMRRNRIEARKRRRGKKIEI